MSVGNILITSVGRRVSLLRAFQNELDRLHIEAKIIVAEAVPKLSTAAQLVDICIKTPTVDHPDYIDYLLKKCVEHQVRIVVPTIDTELEILAEHRDLFKEHGVELIISDISLVKITTNKIRTHDFFQALHISTPKVYNKNDYTLPVFIKPISGSRSSNTFTIKKKDEFNSAHFDNDELIFFEYLDHDVYDEFTCDLYYGKDHRLKSVVPRKRITVLAGEVSRALTRKNELVEFIYEKLEILDGARGCINVQFFIHKTDRSIKAIEVNARFGGGYPLSYMAGANFPKLIIEEYFLNKEVSYSDDWKDNMLMLRYNDEVIVENYQED